MALAHSRGDGPDDQVEPLLLVQAPEIGELNRDALFYLQSRGVDPAAAKALLTRAFIGDALDSVRDEAMREAMMDEAIEWLEPPRSTWFDELDSEKTPLGKR